VSCRIIDAASSANQIDLGVQRRQTKMVRLRRQRRRGRPSNSEQKIQFQKFQVLVVADAAINPTE
jgi:hypothetical protein